MISISHGSPGYVLKISEPGTGFRGFSVKARNLDEVKAAIDHYYGMGHAGDNAESCPLCRDVQAKQRKGRRA